MRFVYARSGGPLLNWSGVTPPYPSRSGETRSLGDWAPTTRNSSALRRYGGRLASPDGAAIGYETSRQLGDLDIPRPGAPEVVGGYESPQPGAAVVHLGHVCTWDEAHKRAHAMSGYMPEGAARAYGQTMLSADAPAATKTFDSSLIRKGAVLAAAYHGVRRHNGSVLWGLLWAAAAYVTPLNGLLVAGLGVAQGFAQPKGPKQNPARRRRKKRPRVGSKAWRKRFKGAARRLDARRRRRKAKPYKAKGFV